LAVHGDEFLEILAESLQGRECIVPENVFPAASFASRIVLNDFLSESLFAGK
jgi:hypothetical protein